MHVVVTDGQVVFALLVFRKPPCAASSLLEDSRVRKRHGNALPECGAGHLFPKQHVFLHEPVIPTHKWSALLTERSHRWSPHWAVG